VKFGKYEKERKRGEKIQLPGNWNKKSIFFELPYWKSLKLQHNLDAMHIVKNVWQHNMNTMNLEGKTKNNIKSHFDLECLGIWPKLHATMIEEGKYTFQNACYTMPSQ